MRLAAIILTTLLFVSTMALSDRILGLEQYKLLLELLEFREN